MPPHLTRVGFFRRLAGAAAIACVSSFTAAPSPSGPYALRVVTDRPNATVPI